jgi:hypothetical protein
VFKLKAIHKKSQNNPSGTHVSPIELSIPAIIKQEKDLNNKTTRQDNRHHSDGHFENSVQRLIDERSSFSTFFLLNLSHAMLLIQDIRYRDAHGETP